MEKVKVQEIPAIFTSSWANDFFFLTNYIFIGWTRYDSAQVCGFHEMQPSTLSMNFHVPEYISARQTHYS